MTATVMRRGRLRKLGENWSPDDFILNAAIILVAGGLLLFLAAPLLTLLGKSFQDQDGQFVGLVNYYRYFTNPALATSIVNTAFVGAVTVAICVPLAFGYAYALMHTSMPGKFIFRAIAMMPLLAPSLLPAMSLLYLFGNQGILKDVVFQGQIYGPRGICLAQIFFCFPQAVLVLTTAMALGDGRLYEASRSLGGSGWLTFRRITLPSCRYGLISAGFVVFTLVTTDFGIPKIIGGNFGVLSTDVYKQVVGQQNFQMGAVVGVVLLTPTVVAFMIDRLLQRRHTAMFSSRSVPYQPTASALDWPAFLFCCVISFAILVVFAVAGWASFIKFWPYNFSMSLANYDFKNFDVLGWQPYFNSIWLAVLVAAIGTGSVIFGAYLVEKAPHLHGIRAVVQALAIMPVAIPGLVLGLGYIFFFNNPSNPASYFYGGLAIMVVNTVVHFYTVPHLTALTALKRLDREFESISDSLRAPRLMTFRRVTLPLCGPVLLDIAIYFFVNAMTTVAAIIFLYNSDTKTAAIAVVNLDDSGMPSAAIAMGMMIFYTCVAAKILQLLAERILSARMQQWMRR